MRKGLRNLYFSRLIVLKPFWNAKLNDFDVIAVDPRKVRVSKTATNELESEFAIEEVHDSVEAIMDKFPEKADIILERSGFTKDMLLVENPQASYKEAWVKDQVIFTFQDIMLKKMRNPYWDWDGILVTEEEQGQLENVDGDEKRTLLETIRGQQEQRQPQTDDDGKTLPQTPHQTEPQTYQAYKFNHFDEPRKPYIFATVLNNENTPIGRTDFITEAAPLQEAVDRRKRQIDHNAEMVNGWLKVDSKRKTN